MNKNDIIATLVIRKIKGVGAVAIKNLWQKGLFQNSPPYYETIEKSLKNLNKEISDEEIEEYIKEAQQIISDSANDDIKFLHLADASYPKQLTELKDPPSILFYKGKIDILNKVIGIIGTREPDTVGLEISKRIASYFYDKGYTICNGLAIGIDEGSIKREGNIFSNVIGVLAGGLNYNQSKTLLKTTSLLAEQVLDAGGLLLSEYDSYTKEDTFKVIKSCRLQAGLSHGLVLVQSKLDGGSRYTLEAYCSLNRPLGVVNISSKTNDAFYEANTAILQNHKEGLSKMTGLKSNKIEIEEIIEIAAKSDYTLLEHSIEKKLKSNGKTSNTLF